MSNGQEDVSSQPLVIVRRRRNVDEEHHGGVWKIAYADFMTAMMAFFLVMWLINAADKKTIVQVAAYFNPMRLTDRVASPKGLEDLSEMDSKQSEEKTRRERTRRSTGSRSSMRRMPRRTMSAKRWTKRRRKSAPPPAERVPKPDRRKRSSIIPASFWTASRTKPNPLRP
jgi:flagellar motor protein MotB